MAVIGNLRLRTTTHRRLVSLLGAVLLAASFSVVHAPAARAQSSTCTEPFAETIDVRDESSWAVVYVHRNCADGHS